MKTRLTTKGGNSFCEAIENIKNKDLEVDVSLENTEYVLFEKSGSITETEEPEEIDKYKKYLFDPGEGNEGGVIVFSTDMDSKELAEGEFKNKFLQVFKTYRNRTFAQQMLNKLRLKHEIYAWTIGKYLRGVYNGDNGKTFSENSMSISIIGENKDKIMKIAEDICMQFDQESVLVEMRNTQQIYFVKI